ncbi:hypothetical protein GCM10010191_35160 [Actinomadura vinacea]|uniref:Uncharacterized protein n=1 Tax=Actinomadura vinacea TaxID=115336 RepID=A0ABN3J2H3_9ACTN
MGGREAAGVEIRIVGAERPDGLELRTRGLAAHGSPELRVSGLAPYLGQGWARVLAALARRLAAAPGTDAAGIPAELDLSPEVTVGLARDGDDLVPVPPRDFTGRPDDWRRDILLTLFPSAHS